MAHRFEDLRNRDWPKKSIEFLWSAVVLLEESEPDQPGGVFEPSAKGS